jgi:hypothetical protein
LTVTILQKHKEIKVIGETKKKLLRISASTIDRILKPERKKYQLKGRSFTKPGTLLKNQIPIRNRQSHYKPCLLNGRIMKSLEMNINSGHYFF